MKNRFILLAIAAFIMSCSSDDNSSGNEQEIIIDEPITENFLPADNGNYWVYETQSTQGPGRDSLYVANDTVINDTSYKKYKSASFPTGFYTNSMNNNSVRQDDGKLLLTGSATTSLSEMLPLNIEVVDFVIFDQYASQNQELSSIDGSFTQQVEGFEVTFTYTLKTVAKETLPNLTVTGQPEYTNVKAVETTLTLKIQTAFGGFPVELLPQQDVLVSKQYYAEGIGVVKTSTDINYQFIDLSGFGITLPFPQSGSEQQEEILVNHLVN